jgi:hypothetical protein
MSCQDAFFTEAHCRIEVEPSQEGLGDPRYVATVSVVDDAAHEVRPLVSRDGGRIAFSGSSEALAVNSSLTYLERQFGGYSEITYRCEDRDHPLTVGAPLVVDR